MAMSRRDLMRALGVSAAGAGALSACGGQGGIRGRRGRRPTTTNPSAKKLAEPDAPLKLASVGASYGAAGRFEKQMSIGVSEAMIDVNARWDGLFGRKVEMQDRVVLPSAGKSLRSAIQEWADQGVTAVVSSLDDDALIAAMPDLVAAKMAVIDVFTSSMAVRAPEVQTAGLLTRLCPNDLALATGHAEAAWQSSSDRGGKPGTVGFVSEDTTQGRSLLHELEQILGPAGGRIVVQHMYPMGKLGDRGAIVKKIVDHKPALLVVNAPHAEAGPLLSDLHRATLDPEGRPQFDIAARVATAGIADFTDAQLVPEALQSATGAEPGGALTSEHVDMMLNVDPNLLREGYAYSQQAYDAVILLALAAYDALSVSGTDIATSIPRVLSGSEKCADYGACRTAMRNALQNGTRETITYEGRTGMLVMGPQNDPIKGSMRSFSWDKGNALQAGNDEGFELEP